MPVPAPVPSASNGLPEVHGRLDRDDGVRQAVDDLGHAQLARRGVDTDVVDRDRVGTLVGAAVDDEAATTAPAPIDNAVNPSTAAPVRIQRRRPAGGDFGAGSGGIGGSEAPDHGGPQATLVVSSIAGGPVRGGSCGGSTFVAESMTPTMHRVGVNLTRTG